MSEEDHLTNIKLPIDFNAIRKAIANEIVKSVGFDTNHVILEEPETPNTPRPTRPYMSFKLTSPAGKNGDDSYEHVSGTIWNSGGVRKMNVSFHCYGTSHEEAYNLMSLWQAVLGVEPVQERLRKSGIAIWIIGELADLSLLLNTGYEGRSHMDVSFGVASNIESDFGAIEHVTVDGTLDEDIEIDFTT
jgi:hypothetical protein